MKKFINLLKILKWDNVYNDNNAEEAYNVFF